VGQKGNNGQFFTKPQHLQRPFASQPGALASVPQDRLLLLADFLSKRGGERFHFSIPLWGSSFCAQCPVRSESGWLLLAFCISSDLKKKKLKKEKSSDPFMEACSELLPGGELCRVLFIW